MNLLVKNTTHILLMFRISLYWIHLVVTMIFIFLKKDVLLLVDVFEKLMNTCLEYNGLDPCHYFSSAGLSWDAMLKMTEI